jgi:hypothetical protein
VFVDKISGKKFTSLDDLWLYKLEHEERYAKTRKCCICKKEHPTVLENLRCCQEEVLAQAQKEEQRKEQAREQAQKEEREVKSNSGMEAALIMVARAINNLAEATRENGQALARSNQNVGEFVFKGLEDISRGIRASFRK